MKYKGLGCLTRNGFAAAFITLLLIGGVSIAQGGILFSPGELSASSGEAQGGVTSHQEIEACAACHPAFWEIDRMTGRCLDCHQGIIAQLESQDGLHGEMLKGESYACQDCHTEHHGPDASLTDIDPETFPHDVTGYSLQAHTLTEEGTLDCDDCHLTLEEFNHRSCVVCHAELEEDLLSRHIQMFGDSCLNCHDGIDTYGDSFDHGRLRFVLLDAHASLECSDCHRGQSSLEDLRQTPGECSACHEDVHQGSFGTGCEQCHTPEGWNLATFDHSLSAFPLTGEHVEVGCQECHTNGTFKGLPVDCAGCHLADDAHNGTLGVSCERCHVSDGWETITFDHTQTAFPLTGAHGSVPCSSCHQGGAFSATPTACAACHSEPAYHSGLFSSGCESCHNASAWSPAGFDQAHTFPLNHEDASGACGECHPSTLHSYTCFNCHDQGETDEEHRDEGISDYSDCMRCHPTGEEDDDDD